MCSVTLFLKCILFHSAGTDTVLNSEPMKGKRSHDEFEGHSPLSKRARPSYKEETGSDVSVPNTTSVKSVQSPGPNVNAENVNGDDDNIIVIEKLRTDLARERRRARQAETEANSLRLRVQAWEGAFKVFQATVRTDASSPGKTYNL